MYILYIFGYFNNTRNSPAQGMRTEAAMAKQGQLLQKKAAVLRRKLEQADASRARLVPPIDSARFLRLQPCCRGYQPVHSLQASLKRRTASLLLESQFSEIGCHQSMSVSRPHMI